MPEPGHLCLALTSHIIADCRGLTWICLLRKQNLYARRFNPGSAAAQYQAQHQQHAALARLVIAGDHIPLRLERKKLRRIISGIFDTSALERNRVHQKAYRDT